MNNAEIEFLSTVRTMCAENPKMLSMIIQAATDGIEEQIAIANERAADFEVIAALMKSNMNEKRISPETKAYYNDTVCKKLEKWQGKTALNWES